METNKKQYKEVTIYGKGDSAISFSPLDHFRKSNKSDEGEGELKGYKIKVTVTNNTFKDKDYIYLEREELLNLLLVLGNKISLSKSIRNSTTSNTDKTFTIKKVSSGDIISTFDIKGSDNLNFKISNLNKIILYKMVTEVLLKEIPRTTNITFNKVELREYIDSLIEGDITTISKKSNIEEDTTTDSGFYLSFINTYNKKSFTNKIKVSETFHNHLKTKGIKTIDTGILLKTIKENTIEDENKFLNKENIDTLKCI